MLPPAITLMLMNNQTRPYKYETSRRFYEMTKKIKVNNFVKYIDLQLKR